jgi:hypothetical protein
MEYICVLDSKIEELIDTFTFQFHRHHVLVNSTLIKKIVEGSDNNLVIVYLRLTDTAKTKNTMT